MKTTLIDIKNLVSNTGQLKGLPKNPRIIRDERFKALVKSIQDDPEMLELRECIVVPHKDKFVVIAGNMRLKACQELGHKKIPCKVLDAKTPVEKLKAITIKDNVPFGEHDFDLLANEWDFDELKEWGLELPEIEELPKDGLTDEDAVPAVPEEPKTKLGDIYVLGNHRLMCGDSTNIQDVEKLIGGGMADMVFTDPPYGINEETDRVEHVKTFKKQGVAKKGKYSKIIGDDSIDTALAAFSICDSLSKIVVYWGGNYYAHKLPPSACWSVWDKRVEDEQRDLNSDCELAYVKHPHKKSVRIFRHLWKGMIKDSEKCESRVHPTQKPVALAGWAFEEYDPKGKTVLDLFGGSGSTMIACEKLGRHARLMELDPKYCDVIVKRWEEFTGKKAELVNG